MGLFDGKIYEMGEKLCSKLIERVSRIDSQLVTETDVGQRLAMKISMYVMSQMAEVIKEALMD